MTKVLTALTLYWLGAGVAVAQVTTATFYGIVTDPTGGVVAGARVTLTNEATGVGAPQATDQRGEFAFNFVPVGSYALRIEMAGFKTYESRNLPVQAGQSIRRMFVLEVGQLSERVTVTAEAAQVNAVSAEQRQSISVQEIRELPLSRRNVIHLAGLNTGAAVTVSGGNQSGTLNFNGLGEGTTSITVDGTDASASSEAPQMGMMGGFNTVYTLSVEAVEEVQTAKGVISAEYSRTLSGNLNLITRSGTNQWHGSLFENYQGRTLNARNQFLSSKVPFTFNQFGGSVGGPIVKNKLFIFGVYEGVREAAFSRQQGTVPTPRLRDAMIAKWPEYKLALDALPLPTRPYVPADATGIYEGVASSRSNDDHFVIKPDYWLTPGHRVSLTYTQSRPDQDNPTLSPINSRLFTGVTDRVTGSYTYYGAAWSGETRIGYNNNNVDRLDTFHLVKDPGKAETMPDGRRVATIRGLGFDVGNSEEMIKGAPVWSFEQKLATQRGRHALKFGGIFFFRRIGGSDIESPRIQYSTEQDFINNVPSQVRVTFGRPPFKGSNKDFGVFLQDDWRVTQKLVVNLGMRYDYFDNLSVRGPNGGAPHLYNPGGLLDSNFTIGPFRPAGNPYDRDGVNFSPRVGVAYNPDGRGKNVIRTAAGILFNPIAADIFSQCVMTAPDVPFRVELSKTDAAVLNLRFPVYNEDVAPLVKGGQAAPGYVLVDARIRAPYSIPFYLGYQRALTANLVFETAFVANRGVKFMMRRMYNKPDRVTGLRPNPKISTSQYFDNSGSSHYFSWQSSLRKRFSRNLTGNVNYTWGKSISNGTGDILSNDSDTQEFFDLRSNRGPSTGDLTHVFNSDFVYELPKLADIGNRLARYALGGWQISGIFSARTGPWFSITQPSALDPTRPDATGLPPVLQDYRKTLQYLNPAAFALVPVSRQSGGPMRAGTLGRNAVRGPGAWNLNFSFGKSFPFAERVRLQLRADMFNAFNHTNFGPPNGRIDQRNFGQLTSAGSRAIQLNARLTF